MKNGSSILLAIASTGLLSIIPIVAIAGTSTPVTLEKKVQENAERQFEAAENKYARIAALAGNRQDELAKKRNEGIIAYKKWLNLKYAAVSHYPRDEDFRAVEAASKIYSQANKDFIDLQKSILAHNSTLADTVSITTLYASAQTTINMK